MSAFVRLQVSFDRVVRSVKVKERVLALVVGLGVLLLVAGLAWVLASAAGRTAIPDLPTSETASLAENPELWLSRRFVSPQTVRHQAVDLCCSWESRPKV